MYSILRNEYARLWNDIRVILIQKNKFEHSMIKSYLNLSIKYFYIINERYSYNKCKKIRAIYNVRVQKTKRNLYNFIILNVIFENTFAMRKIRKNEMWNFLNWRIYYFKFFLRNHERVFRIFFNVFDMHNLIKHLIDLKENKMSRIKCIYNMSQNKFVTIRKYIANALKKN